MSELDPAPLLTISRPTDANASPDWATRIEEICCPLCEYNLRGLTDPRCPECGYTFGWSQLLDPANRKHPYLFEHHPEMNIRSFLKTAIGGLRPRRLWTSLTPTHAILRARLIGYWVIATCIGLAGIIIASFYPVISDAYANPQFLSPPQIVTHLYVPIGTTFPPPPPPAMPSLDDLVDYWRATSAPLALSFCGLLIVWPWVTLLALMVFQISMRRVGIRHLHVLRVALYSGDFPFWVGTVGVMIGATLLGVQVAFGTPNYQLPETFYGPVLITCWLILAHRLYVAYKRYLKFDHPLATVLAAQIVAALTVLAIAVQFSF